MIPRELAPSVDALIAGASSRELMSNTDSKSGARFERVVIDGASYVLKHVDRRSDWIMRQTGDVGSVPVLVWSSGVLDVLPDCIDHATVGAARGGLGGAVLMRDVSEHLVPSGDAPLGLEQHLRFLDHLAAAHAASWEWRDTVGLIPLSNRYLFFGPWALECEAALGYPEPVPKIAHEGWARLARVAPTMADTLARLHNAPWQLLGALERTPRAFLHGDWKLGNLGSLPDGRTVLVDWSLCGAGPPVAELAHYLALNTARLPRDHTKDDAIVAYRDALERHGIDTSAWFDHQLDLCVLGVMLQLGWEKSFDEVGDELAWWEARVARAVQTLSDY